MSGSACRHAVELPGSVASGEVLGDACAQDEIPLRPGLRSWVDPIHDVRLLDDLAVHELFEGEVHLDAVDQVPIVVALQRSIWVAHLCAEELSTEVVVDDVGSGRALTG